MFFRYNGDEFFPQEVIDAQPGSFYNPKNGGVANTPFNSLYIPSRDKLDKVKECLLKIPREDPMTRMMWLDLNMEYIFGFVNHMDPEAPVQSLVLFHQVFSITRLLSNQRMKVMALDLPKKTGMSIEEILDMPNGDYLALLKNASTITDQESEIADQIQKELDSLNQKKK